MGGQVLADQGCVTAIALAFLGHLQLDENLVNADDANAGEDYGHSGGVDGDGVKLPLWLRWIAVFADAGAIKCSMRPCHRFRLLFDARGPRDDMKVSQP